MRVIVPLMPIAVRITLERRTVDPPRFRLRTLMVAVAVAALLMFVGTVALGWRSSGFRSRAAYHDAMECRHRDTVRRIEDLALAANDPKTLRETLADAAYVAKIERYHAAMKAKYLRAASHPWESVPPDPPRP